MNIELFVLGGYGQFVWPAFIFTLTICFLFYLRTSNELKKQEKLYSREFAQSHTAKIKIAKNKEPLSVKPAQIS